ncbi:MAG: phenylalanyl-tRNA synthetase alpha chain [Parcubacteria group bacterium LiPW_39]|nr:MAG: phenylalanyl-tRNA synthetase alpha chain [Parcubacteria group bacterium LiPW_39]
MKSLEDLRVRYLGRKGELARIFGEIKKLAGEEKISLGRQANELKKEIGNIFIEKNQELKSVVRPQKDWLDITAPGIKPPRGHLHPRTQVMRGN